MKNKDCINIIFLVSIISSLIKSEIDSIQDDLLIYSIFQEYDLSIDINKKTIEFSWPLDSVDSDKLKEVRKISYILIGIAETHGYKYIDV
jgi:hypothetical protein